MVEWFAPLIKPLLELLGFTLPKVESKAKGLLQLLNSHQNLFEYNQHIEEICGTTNLIGLNKPVSISQIYTKVLILDEPTANQRHTFSSLNTIKDADRITNSIPKKDGIEVVKDPLNKRLLILGSPGSGKTTFLKQIALQTSLGKFQDKIAVFITLKKWIDEKEIDLMDYLAKQFEICNFKDAKPTIQRYLENGNFIILFDGLDEIFTQSDKAKDIFREIDYFSSKYINSKLIITCRTNELPHGFPKFTKVEIAKFGNEEIKFFVENWFALQDLQQLVPLFFKEFEKSKNEKLKEMAGIPILLSLLCIVFKHEQKFYQKQIEIYKKAVDILLSEDELNKLKDYSPDRSEIYFNLHLSNRKELFNKIAYHYSEKKQIFFEKDDITKIVYQSLREILETNEYIDGLKILKGIETQHGILIERFKDIYSFSHRSFHEYFTANYFANKNRLAALLTPRRILGGWREVILNTASLLNNADEFFKVFHNSIKQIIGDDSKLINLLKLVDEKAQSYPSPIKFSGIRFFYLYLIFIKDSSLNTNYDFYLARLLPSEVSQIYNLFRETLYQKEFPFPSEAIFELNDSIYYDLSSIEETSRPISRTNLVDAIKHEIEIQRNRRKDEIFHDLSENKNIYIDRAIKQIQELDINGAQLIEKAIKLLSGNDNHATWDCQLLIAKLIINRFFNKIKYRNTFTNISQKLRSFLHILALNCNDVDDKILKRTLLKLKPLKDNLSDRDRKKIISAIDKSLFSQSFKINIKLNAAQERKLMNYLEANRLLLECLDLATVTNREKIENQILSISN